MGEELGNYVHQNMGEELGNYVHQNFLFSSISERCSLFTNMSVCFLFVSVQTVFFGPFLVTLWGLGQKFARAAKAKASHQKETLAPFLNVKHLFTAVSWSSDV